ncbi:hypothetical protein LCGC14_1876050 [marine sediment metagenome]|uniref:Uncharacterized protein n=1 Tax=marine sediment metagenome TaxID=412755 RepID=A0A0F9GRR6_9ZZZZ
MFEEINEPVQWLGFAPSGRKIGRVIDKGGTARYITLDMTPGIGFRYSEVYDNKNVICDVLCAIALDHERLECIVDAGITKADQIKLGEKQDG